MGTFGASQKNRISNSHRANGRNRQATRHNPEATTRQSATSTTIRRPAACGV